MRLRDHLALFLRRITYVVTTRVTRLDGDGEEMLMVEAEQQHVEDRWTGHFSRQCKCRDARVFVNFST
jgi:hypothetical protein